MYIRRAVALSLALAAYGLGNVVSGESEVGQWQVFEVEMTAQNQYENPYVDGLPDGGESLVKVTFTGISGEAQGMRYAVKGFWDGENTWRVRFASTAPGVWSYITTSKDPGLDGIKGVFTCTQWNDAEKQANPVRRGFIRVCKTGKRPGRYFEYSDETPFLWIGDTWWNWTKREISFSSFKKLVDDRVQKGFTVGQMFIAGKGWTKSSCLLDETYSAVDLAHMRRVERMIAYANAKGITVWVHGWWGGKDISEAIGPDKMRRWWRYLIHRLGAYNVIWVLAGEYNMHNYGGLGLEFWKELGQLIDSEDPYERIISVHPTPPAWDGGADAPQWSTGEVIHKEDWLDYNQSQVGHGRWRNELIPLVVAGDYARVPSKPVVVTEPWYEFINGSATAEEIRFGAWAAILSGAAGHSYGGGHIWRAHVPEATESAGIWPLQAGFEPDTLDYSGAVSIGHMAKFLSRLRWWELEPHPELVLDYPQKFCVAVPGKEFVVYLRWGDAVRVNLNPSLENDTFEYTWFDPSTGENRKNGTVSGGRIAYFYAPTRYPHHPQHRDWVLHLRKKH
ncbi:MAG: DUF4038 domain-containing protein [Planctomycetota bacterium]|nr:MAG: DUF4038 domain-containing protein [Planctomycetota bacterium]